jgi:hypothetical protein
MGTCEAEQIQCFLVPADSWSCGVFVSTENLRNYIDGDGSQVAYMVVNSGLKLRQDDTQLNLSLSSADLRAQVTNAVF